MIDKKQQQQQRKNYNKIEKTETKTRFLNQTHHVKENRIVTILRIKQGNNVTVDIHTNLREVLYFNCTIHCTIHSY